MDRLLCQACHEVVSSEGSLHRAGGRRFRSHVLIALVVVTLGASFGAAFGPNFLNPDTQHLGPVRTRLAQIISVIAMGLA